MLDSGEVMIEIGAMVWCDSPSNTVDISLKREKEVFLVKERDGNVVTIGSGVPPPFPNPHIRLNNIVSFDPHYMYPLLFSTLQDPILCSRLSVKIASESERAPGPLYISLHVTLTPHRFLGDETGMEPDEETCPICLEELHASRKNSIHMPCGHEFHGYCISQWLGTNDTCPMCRSVVEDSDDEDYAS